MWSSLPLFVCFGAVFAGVTREKRQVNCVEPDIPNVCTGNLNGRIYLPHPLDSSKFIQCADNGRMFIIRCPMGETFDTGRSTCMAKQVVNPPQTNNNNPCTAENIRLGVIFFPYTADKTKFIECNEYGQPTVLSCPSRLVYDNARQSCVLVTSGTNTGTGTNTGGTATQTGVIIGTGTSSNPCTMQAIQSQSLFFPHPDKTKFIHCDLAGDAFVMQCPANLVWNQATTNCASPYTMLTGNTGSIG